MTSHHRAQPRNVRDQIKRGIPTYPAPSASKEMETPKKISLKEYTRRRATAALNSLNPLRVHRESRKDNIGLATRQRNTVAKFYDEEGHTSEPRFYKQEDD